MRDGHLNHCKLCFLDKDRARYAENGDSKRESARAYVRANPEKVAERKRRYNAENAERIAKTKAQYRRDHAAENREYFAKYRLDNPDVMRMHNQLRRARLRATLVIEVAAHQLSEKLSLFGGLCVYCGGDLSTLGIHWDHWKPLSKGGPHMLSNLYPSCPSCNLSKFAKWPYRAPRNYATFGLPAGEEVLL